MKKPYLNFLLAAATGLGTIASTTCPAEEVLSIPLPGSLPRLDSSFGRQPLAFERNVGQTDPEVKFLTRGPGYQLFLTETEAVMVLTEPRTCEGKEGCPQPAVRKRGEDTAPYLFGEGAAFVKNFFENSSPHSRSRGDEAQLFRFSQSTNHRGQSLLTSAPTVQPNAKSGVLRMQLAGANSHALIGGEQMLRAKVNYFIGNDPARWRTNVPTFARISYRQVYPGIDLVYYGNGRGLEYDFVVAPGADPELIALSFEGAERVELDERGDLIAWVAGRPVRWQKPLVYQEVDGQRIDIAAAYRLRKDSITYEPKADQVIGFELAAYDRTQPLMIDPALVYSTYLGGGKSEYSSAIAVDGQGNAYITGGTSSINFPTKAALKSTLSGGLDAFVTKLSPTGELLYSTYLGGGGDNEYDEGGYGLAVDKAGTCYLAGRTSSTNFPLVNPIQAVLGGKLDGFVAALKPDGSALTFSSYLGGSEEDWFEGIAVDTSGNIYMSGSTYSSDFPLRNAIQGQISGWRDAIVVKLEPGGKSMIYSTYLGGSDYDGDVHVVADDQGNAYIAGQTYSQDFPVRNAYQPSLDYGDLYHSDFFYAKLLPDGSDLVYCSYFGGESGEFTPALALGPDGSLYITGASSSPGLATPGAYQTSPPAWFNILARFNSTDGSLLAATYLDPGIGPCITIDANGNPIVGGQAYENRPMVDPLQPVIAGNGDCFIAKFSPDLSSVLFSTYLGGAGGEGISSLAIDPSGNLIVAGTTTSTNFPVLNAFQSNLGGVSDAFVAKISFAEVLKVSRSGQSLIFSWPAAATGFQLESTGTVSPGAVWEKLATAPVVIGDEQVVTVDIEGSSKFYRLKKP